MGPDASFDWPRQYRDVRTVSSHGLAAACDVRPARMRGDTGELDAPDYAQIAEGDVVYVTATQLPAFIEHILPGVAASFVLVTGDADVGVPVDLWRRSRMRVSVADFVSDPRLIHWFAQNCDLDHTRVTPMPIGLDFHTLGADGSQSRWGPSRAPIDQDHELREIAGQLPALEKRPPNCLVSFHFSLFGDRIGCLAALRNKSFVRLPLRYLERSELWRAHGGFSFVASPRGNGMDCHRTWEALALGAIPIVRSSALDPLFEGLPVLVVDDWRAVDAGLLADFKQRVVSGSWHREKLELAYWRDLFRTRPNYSRDRSGSPE